MKECFARLLCSESGGVGKRVSAKNQFRSAAPTRLPKQLHDLDLEATVEMVLTVSIY